jgi:hypothetical protein
MASNENSSFGAELDAAGSALEAFASGPASEAGDAIAAAFARAGRAIRGELEAAARSGEADFDRLGRKIAEVLAQMALRQVVSGGGGGSTPVNVTMNVAGGAGASSGAGASANQIAALVARAAARGARFS